MLPRFLAVAAVPIIAAISGDAQRPAFASTGSEAAAEDAAAFLDLEKVEVPIFGNSRIEGRIEAHLMLQMASPREAGLASRHMPELRTQLVETLLDYGSLHVSGFAPVDAEGLSAAVNASVKARNKAVRRVLILELSASPL